METVRNPLHFATYWFLRGIRKEYLDDDLKFPPASLADLVWWLSENWVNVSTMNSAFELAVTPKSSPRVGLA